MREPAPGGTGAPSPADDQRDEAIDEGGRGAGLLDEEAMRDRAGHGGRGHAHIGFCGELAARDGPPKERAGPRLATAAQRRDQQAHLGIRAVREERPQHAAPDGRIGERGRTAHEGAHVRVQRAVVRERRVVSHRPGERGRDERALRGPAPIHARLVEAGPRRHRRHAQPMQADPRELVERDLEHARDDRLTTARTQRGRCVSGSRPHARPPRVSESVPRLRVTKACS